MLESLNWLKLENPLGSVLKIAIDLENAAVWVAVGSQAKSAAAGREESLADWKSSAGCEQSSAGWVEDSDGGEENWADGEQSSADWDESSAGSEQSWAHGEQSSAGCAESSAAGWKLQVGLSGWQLAWDNIAQQRQNSWNIYTITEFRW